MEKWAKTLNEKKDELMKKASKTSVVASSSESSPMFFDQSMTLAMESDIPNYLEENYVFGLENSNTYQPVDVSYNVPILQFLLYYICIINYHDEFTNLLFSPHWLLPGIPDH